MRWMFRAAWRRHRARRTMRKCGRSFGQRRERASRLKFSLITRFAATFTDNECDCRIDNAGCPGPFWAVWRTLRAGDADASIAGVGRGIFPLATGPGISTRVAVLFARILRTSDAALFCRATHAGTRRGEDLSQTLRPAPHRRA